MADEETDIITKRIEECMDILGGCMMELVRSHEGATSKTWEALILLTFFLNLKDPVSQDEIDSIHDGLHELEEIQDNPEQMKGPLMDLCFEAGKIYKKHRGFTNG